jgi:hypothetical protein
MTNERPVELDLRHALNERPSLEEVCVSTPEEASLTSLRGASADAQARSARLERALSGSCAPSTRFVQRDRSSRSTYSASVMRCATAIVPSS